MPTLQQGPDVLQRFGHDLTALAEAGRFQPLSGYEPWVNRVIEVLARPCERRFRHNPVLIGLTAGEGWPIIAEVVRRMASGEVPDSLRGLRVIALDWEALVSDIPDLEQLSRSLRTKEEPRSYTLDDLLVDDAVWGTFLSARRESHERWCVNNPLYQRLESIFAAVRSSNMQVLLYVEQMHRLYGGEMERYPVDMFNLLKPALARSELQILGTSTLDAYRQHIEKNASIQCRFQEVCSPALASYLGHDNV